ncbi:MAG: hypothetical protein EAZ84_09730 [Verrucomicrobia bacterium]|nr:MAG: hypothetical protein EAZ84_09730 [Verrucomicrobiota bacterium]TAE86727.1 MAG: hypothetical protein EAZ82_10075 [Verrucomicrobiota bacterium]TAF24515.1 MAG: hypothetical protein EAZ71_10405 [Verrucomicrobiota bacterium]
MSFHLQNLHFSPTPATLAIGLTSLVLIGALAVLACKRSPHPKRSAVLESLRFFCTLLVVLLLWKPEWLSVVHPETKPQIVILRDASKSMETLDAELPEFLSPEREVISRASWTNRILDSPLWKTLSQGGANEVFRRDFSAPSSDTPPALAGTDLSSPIEDLLENETNLRAAILLSDGDFNTGNPPVVAAQKLLQRGIPLFTIPVGSEKRLPDLDLLTVSAPAYGIVGENVQIPFTIRSSLDREVRTTIRLRDDSGLEKTKEIVLAPGTETYDAILWKLEKEGSSTLELSMPLADGERIATNNSRKFALSGRPESIKVLVIDSLPRWEYRYLRNALSRDPGVELSCLLFHPQLGRGNGPDYIQDFPEKPEELSSYDVIFIGDVGVAPDQLTQQQCELLRGLVENQASGIVFMPGPQGNQFTLLDSALGDLVPVSLDDANKRGFHDPVASPLTLTSEGRSSLLTMLADSEEANPEVWRSLPGFHWHAPVIKSKGGAEVLAVHSNRRGRFGPIPIIITKSAGYGKVLFMGIDSAWRWRRGVEDKYHYRFWGQVARWMSYQRNMAAGERVRLYFTPERPVPGDSVALNANAFDANGTPLEEGTVFVDATAPDGSLRRISLEKNNSAWGAYSGRLKINQPGEWKLKAAIDEADAEAIETTLLAQGIELEPIGQPARPEVLEEMSRIAKGRTIHPDQLPDLIREIVALPEPRPIENRLPLWSHAATVAGIILLLAIFWTGRKLNGSF